MPRKGQLDRQVGVDGPRFNEAGAVMPRKGLALPQRNAAQNRFNEAGAVMPRKGALGAAAYVAARIALQ